MKKPVSEILKGLPEDKTSTAIKKKPVKIKAEIKPQIKEKVVEIEFKPIKFIGDTTYKLNYIGIRRILIKIGGYLKMPKISLWKEYEKWFNETFNKINEEKIKPEIFESDK